MIILKMHQFFHKLIFNSDPDKSLKNHFQLYYLINKQKYKNSCFHISLGNKIQADFS